MVLAATMAFLLYSTSGAFLVAAGIFALVRAGDSFGTTAGVLLSLTGANTVLLLLSGSRGEAVAGETICAIVVAVGAAFLIGIFSLRFHRRAPNERCPIKGGETERRQ